MLSAGRAKGMRLGVALAMTFAWGVCSVQAQGTRASRDDGSSGQAASARPAGVTIQPNIGTPQKPEYALFSPDKRVLATSDSKRIKIWDIATGRLLRTLEHLAYNTGIAFALDGRTVFAGYKDGSVRIGTSRRGS